MPNLSSTEPFLAKIGDYVKYTLKNLNDTTMYSGKVVAICDYEAAKAYADVLALHQAMLTGDAIVNSDSISTVQDVTCYQFLIVECYDGVRRPVGFCTDNQSSKWTNEFYIIEPGQTITISLFNVSISDAKLALQILTEQGFSCSINK